MGACVSSTSYLFDSFTEEKPSNPRRESDRHYLSLPKHSSLRKSLSLPTDTNNNNNKIANSLSLQKHASFPDTTNQSLNQLLSSTDSSLFSLCEHYLEFALSSVLDQSYYMEMKRTQRTTTLTSIPPLPLESDLCCYHHHESPFDSLGDDFTNNDWMYRQDYRFLCISFLEEKKRSQKVSLNQQRRKKGIPILTAIREIHAISNSIVSNNNE
ncbi:hypothetical protein FDP41_001887 [Naegleria fowleri]|uniref:Uncharacterized protein n=1 Tax=Naegleria fowleri TaxID=5763 RepID=A0A6A5BP05_NAEFO|nr:uncharacterized protein FDP41_001887 [Naegleria fowleri]KAF0978817.1 hypothetical protein FDP41_001887 [Naegleria fowleri]